MEILIVVALLCALAFTAIQMIKLRMVRTLCRMGAVKVYGELRSLFAGEHEFREAERTEFEGLEFEAYDSVGEVLLARQFRRLGAVEDLTVSKVHPDRRTIVELYADAVGTTVVATYQVSGMQVSDVLSETTGGRSFLTTNAEVDKLIPPPAVDRQGHPAESPIATLVSAHEERLRGKDVASSRASFREFRSLGDAIDSMRRYTKLVADHRQSVGLLTEPELTAMVTEPGQKKAAKMLWEEFRRLAEEDSKAA